MQKNENPIVLCAVLLVISVIVAALLGFTNSITVNKIAENVEKEQLVAKQEVLSDASEFKDVNYSNGLVKAVYEAFDNNENSVGWCVNVKPYGYGGEIDIIVGITSEYKLSGVKVVSNSETAGLGAKCSTDASFTEQFKNKEMPLGVIKNGTAEDNEIVAITGATITSKAVTNGVNAAFDAVKEIGGGSNE